MRKLITILPLLFASCLDVSNPADTQLAKELKAIDDYVAGATFIKVTSGNNSGIRIGVTSFGSGAPPHEGQTVTAIYTGRLLSDWSIFETDTINDKLEKIPVRGLRFGIESLPEGTTATIFLASIYGFGPRGSSKVPGNTTIAYEVTLEKVVKTDEELTQFKEDTTAIHSYLDDEAITAIGHPSGIWYSSDSNSTGLSPNVYELVSFHYKGTLLSSGEIFQEGDISKQIIFSLIDGLKIGLPLIKTGTTATFYIPSGLGYGPTGSSSIPANSNLIFEIKLNSVE
ncbi:MAG: FKBP-type peptidyl-prolyl cis-trans isomerase [Bacteroidota bacterium]